MKMHLNAQAQAFLLYVYFGIVPGEPEDGSRRDGVILKCVQRAYQDFCRTLEMQDEYKGTKTAVVKKRAEKLTVLNQQLAAGISELLDGKASDFDTWHHKTCSKLIKKAAALDFLKKINRKGDENYVPVQFSYGQAQKWVNMSLKYLWLLGVVPAEMDASLHVPADRYIIEATWAYCDVPGKKEGKFGPNKYYPWSTWTETEYNRFRDSLKKENATLKWENETWIKFAAANDPS